MSSRILGSGEMPELSPIAELDSMAREGGRFTFRASDRREAEAWQREFRDELGRTLGFLDTPKVDPAAVTIEEIDRGDFIRRKVLISTAPGAKMPVYILIPKGGEGPFAAVIAYAGHGYGAKEIVGLTEDGRERYEPEGYQKDFAVALCRAGFVAVTPEIGCFGERREVYALEGDLAPSTCHNAATYAFMLGKSILGSRVRDGMRLVDYLHTVPEADAARLGVMGISGGGMLTFFHTAVDTRVRACVVSGYFNTFRESILAINHCTCNFVPGLLSLGEMTDVYGLVAPRPMLVEAGARDTIFPIGATRRSVERAREICAVIGGDPSRDVELDEFDGEHRISGVRAYDFLMERIGG